MKVEIWSDVMCPFCYIGKRRFEKAIKALGNDVEIEYKSFLLDANLKTDPSISAKQHLSEAKGMSIDDVEKMHQHVSNMANEEGLDFDFDRSVVANSINAHRLLHLAKKEGKQAALKESLLKAHFTDGKNIDDAPTLLELAERAGISKQQSEAVLSGDTFSDAMVQDIKRAKEIGVKGVPFFVFNERYAISGAQSVEVFKEALEQAANS